MSDTDDRMAAIQADVNRRYQVFDQQRQKLVAAYHRTKTPKAALKALAKIVRQHGEYVNQGLLSGWQTSAILTFADEISKIADELD